MDRMTREALGPFLANMEDPACIIDRGMHLVAVNDLLLSRHDSEIHELLGRQCHEVFFSRNTACESCPTVKAFDTRRVVRSEQRGSDGRLYEVISRPFNFWEGDSRHSAILEISRDITERHEILQRFKDSQDKYIFFLNQLNEAVFLFGRLGQLTYANPAAEALLGESVDTMSGRKLEHFFTADSLAKAKRIMVKTLGGKSVSGTPLAMVTGKGKRHIMISTSPTLQDGEVIGAIVLASDVSKKAKKVRDAVTKVHDLTHRLKESEESYRRLFYLVPEAIILASMEDGEILDVNENFLQLFECDHQDLSGKTISQLFMDADPYGINDYTPFPLILAALKEEVGIDVQEMACRTLTGRYFPALASFSTARYGNATYIIGVIRDISEEKMIREELKNRSQYLYDLVLELAHNIRNPITVIGGFTRRAARNSGHLSDRELGIIVHELSRLEGLVKFVHSLSSLLKTGFSLSRVSPKKLFERVMSDPEVKRALASAKVAWEVEKGCPDILGDFDHLKLLLCHLVTDNPDPEVRDAGERRLTFRASREQGQQMVKLIVEEEREAALTQKSLDFPDAPAVNNSSHKEMEPALPRLIVTRHGGSMSVEQMEGRGARIVLLLPSAP